ncbi:hypothetical protein OsI_36020 [Oryza sativa Indica Group]|uniref:Uncharacterized protein n=1 Tax=Oryza sativa subsp. indica TaxID=39946 RepID=B8BKD0_ORYSI|nr:hypothetical protein OsI_36020 [Oryza sativa Indica Group]
MVATRSTTSRRCLTWWWLACCCFVSWVASSSWTAAACVAVSSLPGFDGPLPFSLETGYVYILNAKREYILQSQYFFLIIKDYIKYRYVSISMILFIHQALYSPVHRRSSLGWSKLKLAKLPIHMEKNGLKMIQKWLHDHPRFSLNPLYIGGDSYSGMIVPTLTLAIDESNGSEEKPFFNLKGYIAGNPVTDYKIDEDGRIPFLHGMGLISDELYEHAKETCGEKYSAPSNAQCAHSVQAINDKASHVLLKIWANDETVRESLGVQKGTVGEWKRCNRDIDYNSDVRSTVEYHLTLMRKGYRAIIYRCTYMELTTTVEI